MIRPRPQYYLAGATSVMTFAVFLASLGGDFLNWDDTMYVVDNAHIRNMTVGFFKWALTTFHADNWHPLTWVSHAMDYAIWGLDPVGHHLTSVLLHAANTFLVVIVSMRLMEAVKTSPTLLSNGTRSLSGGHGTLIAAGTTGLLFGIHPLHVESVAWVAERKDVLCGLFYLLSVLSYLKYRSNKFYRTYFLSLAFFILALMSKPMAVSLPAVLLILDWYPLQRTETREGTRAALREKIPFIALSLIASVLTMIAQKAVGVEGMMEEVPLAERLLVAAHSLMEYLRKIVLPDDLSPFYPYPGDISLLSPGYLSAIFFVAGITVFCIALLKRQRTFLAIWGYYLVTLLPVIGIVRVGSQAMADRYMYLPGLGPFLLAGMAGAWLWIRAGFLKRGGRPVRTAMAVAAVAAVALMLSVTLKQITIWNNSMELWSYVINKEPDRVPIAYNNRGKAFREKGRLDLAIEDYSRAIAINPAFALAYNNRGVARREKGRIETALEDFSAAINRKADYANAYNNRGLLYQELGDAERAMKDYTEAVKFEPLFAGAYNNRGALLGATGQDERAIDDFSRAIALDSNNYQAYINRGSLYLNSGRNILAGADFRKACALGSEAGCEALRGK